MESIDGHGERSLELHLVAVPSTDPETSGKTIELDLVQFASGKTTGSEVKLELVKAQPEFNQPYIRMCEELLDGFVKAYTDPEVGDAVVVAKVKELKTLGVTWETIGKRTRMTAEEADSRWYNEIRRADSDES